jgi:hypothetical protein
VRRPDPLLGLLVTVVIIGLYMFVLSRGQVVFR